jgi:hypothetical protein
VTQVRLAAVKNCHLLALWLFREPFLTEGALDPVIIGAV